MKLNKVHVTWLTVTLLVAAIGAGVYLWQRQQNDDEIANLQNKISQLESVNNTKVTSETVQAAPSASSTTAPEDHEHEPVSIFEPGGLFDSSLRDTITTNILEPFTLYQSDLGQPVVAFHVETSQVDGEYIVTAILDNAAYSGFLIGGGYGFDWVPECLNECTFSDEFKALYPDIAGSSAL